MRIAFTTRGTDWDAMMDPRFGRTEFFLVFDEKTGVLTHFDNRETGNEAHGAGPKTAQHLFNLNPDILITGNGPGGNAASALEKSGIMVYYGANEMTVREAYEAYKNDELSTV
ncbi:MAG: NifB/NifX family molybdenum-iron cluster-binding protein [Bacteroidales bacterium]|nr:NifB/NifX family molybdenum-iron cluster-binding protein [Bacteroidales bacterium]